MKFTGMHRILPAPQGTLDKRLKIDSLLGHVPIDFVPQDKGIKKTKADEIYGHVPKISLNR